MRLADALRSERGGALGFAIGVVTDVSPLTVQLNGDTVDIVSPKRLAGYTPTLADTVLVLRPGAGVLVVDKII